MIQFAPAMPPVLTGFGIILFSGPTIMTIWPCGDGIPSHGGWKIKTETAEDGTQRVVRSEASEEAYRQQNLQGWPGMTYAEVESCHRISREEGVSLRDAFFRVVALDKLTREQKLTVAMAPEVYSRRNPVAVQEEAQRREAEERLAALEGGVASPSSSRRGFRTAGETVAKS